ncbi:MAG: hypothetical protein IJD60_10660 [Clostridia bacterium]|nr:hypothetical protein [Clostridia bacterium]
MERFIILRMIYLYIIPVKSGAGNRFFEHAPPGARCGMGPRPSRPQGDGNWAAAGAEDCTARKIQSGLRVSPGRNTKQNAVSVWFIRIMCGHAEKTDMDGRNGAGKGKCGKIVSFFAKSLASQTTLGCIMSLWTINGAAFCPEDEMMRQESSKFLQCRESGGQDGKEGKQL